MSSAGSLDPTAIVPVPSGGGSAAAQGCNPRYSVTIPIHHRGRLSRRGVADLVGEMGARGIDYDVLLLAESGSVMRTPDMCSTLASANPRIQALRVPIPDYGYAMKTGMPPRRGDYVVNFDIDFHDPFMLAAGDLLDTGAGVVAGSKLMEGAEDKRSPAGISSPTVSLPFDRFLFDPRMDDTHGMKVLRREVVQEYVRQTVMRQDIFDTELIIRARRGGVKVAAIPVTVEEKRKARSSIYVAYRAPYGHYSGCGSSCGRSGMRDPSGRTWSNEEISGDWIPTLIAFLIIYTVLLASISPTCCSA